MIMDGGMESLFEMEWVIKGFSLKIMFVWNVLKVLPSLLLGLMQKLAMMLTK